MKFSLLKSLVVASATLAWSVPAPAASVKFSHPATIAGDADVLTAGTLERAINFGGTEQKVQGVLFAAGNIGSGKTSVEIASTTVASSEDCIVVLAEAPTFALAGDPYDSLSASYKALLGSGAYANTTRGELTVTLNGLTKGNTYTVQFFVNDSRDFHGGNRHETVNSGGAQSDPIDFSSTHTAGGVGQHLTGTFTADGTSQAFVFTPVNTQTDDAQINAMQVRVTR